MPERFNADFWNYLDKLVASTRVVIDRPKGSEHPVYDEAIYPLDYGYLAGTTSSDGGGIDVWIGKDAPLDAAYHVNAVICTIDLIKRDTEIKILLNCSETDMLTIVNFVRSNQTGGLLIRRDE